MRSNNPNATHFLLRRNLFIGVIVFLIIFFTLPFWGLSHIPEEKETILTYYEPQNRAESFGDLVSSNVMHSLSMETMIILYGGLGFLSAMMLMRHLFSRRQGMLHAALPDKRETEFLRRIIGYLVLCLAPILVNFVLYLLVVAANRLLPYIEWGRLLGKFGILLLINVYGFAMGMLSSVLTGTYWAALLAGAVLIVGAEGLIYLWYLLAGSYLHTMFEAGIGVMLRNVSPAYSLYKGFYHPAEFVWVPAVTMIVAALAISFLLYRIRKTEKTERTLAFDWLHTLMGFVLPLMGGSLMGMVVFLSFNTEISLVLGMIFGVLLTYWVCRIVFNQRFCGILKKWYLPAAAALVLVTGIAVLHTDAFGYDHYMPEREELTAITYIPQSYHTDETITLTSEEALDAAYGWCTLMRDEADGMENGINAFRPSYSASSVVVMYQMGNRTVMRHYPNEMVRTEAQPYLQAVIESDDYKQSIIETLGLNGGEAENLYLNASRSVLQEENMYEQFGLYPNYMNLDRRENAAQMDQWLNAAKEDVMNRTFADKKKDPLYTMQIILKNPETNDYDFHTLQIYPDDSNLLQAIFGDKAQDVIEYATGGYAANEEMVALQVTYTMSRKELKQNDIPERDAVKEVKLASSPEEAAEWVRCTQSITANNYYFMPDYEDVSYSCLYLYNMNDLIKAQSYDHFEIPADKTLFYQEYRIPTSTVRNFIGK